MLLTGLISAKARSWEGNPGSYPCGKALEGPAGLCWWAGAACGQPHFSLTFILPGLPEAGDEAGPAGLESLAVHGQAGGADLGWRRRDGSEG